MKIGSARDVVPQEKARHRFDDDCRNADFAQHQSWPAGPASEVAAGDQDITRPNLLRELRPAHLHRVLLQFRHCRIAVIGIDRVSLDRIAKLPDAAADGAVQIKAHAAPP
jgi:hypothetical protein